MNAVFPLALFGAAAGLLAATSKRDQRWERQMFWAALVAHALAAYAMVTLTRYVYGQGDMLGFHRHGLLVAAHMRVDFDEYFPRVIRMLFHYSEPELSGYSTGPSNTMMALATLLAYILNGSLYASCMVVSIASFFGKLAIYRALREGFPKRYHPRIGLATLLVPSVVFWSSGLLKESIAVSGIGLLVWGGHLLARKKRMIVGGICIGLGILTVGLVKPYILIPFAAAVGAYLYIRSLQERGVRFQLRPTRLIVALSVAVVLVVVVGRQFPRFDITELGTQIAAEQELGQTHTGGSTYSFGDTPTDSLGRQILLTPYALATALFRPFIFESGNLMMFFNGLEMLVVAILFLLALRRRGARGCLRSLFRSPELAFCAVFTAVLALGVGLATSNLGTLSRYRMPLLPFFLVTLFVLSQRKGPRREAQPSRNVPSTLQRAGSGSGLSL